MPQSYERSAQHSEPQGHRSVWIAWTAVLVIAGGVYACKAAEERSAFLRWRHQILEFWQGKDIFHDYMFPNPPILPLTLSPLMALPPMACAMSWFAIKCVLVSASVLIVMRLAQGRDGPSFPWWALLAVLALSLRPILSDLQHGNINILILFLIVTSLSAWSRGYDVLAGLLLALAITYKVTPALFVPYFAWKRSWRTVGATLIGIGMFLFVVPSLIIGVGFNGQCLMSWWHRILSPYISQDVMSEQEVNQSLIGLLSRLLTVSNEGRYGRLLDRNVVSWSPSLVASLAKGISVLFVGMLLYLCRTRTARRDDGRLLGEFSLVVLTMLIVSERSWKHHFVTLVLPYAYVSYRAFVTVKTPRARLMLTLGMLTSTILILTTSSEVGGFFANGKGHKFALYYGMFFWGAVVMYVATAWMVRAERARPDESLVGPIVPSPHFPAQANRAPAG